MRIGGEIPKISGVYGKDKKIRRTDKMGSVHSKKDDISISGKGKDFQATLDAVRSKPDIRQQKVDEIKEKIEAGTYNISGKQIAEKIIDSIINTKI